MSQTAITLAFEHWKAQQGATGEPVLLDEFVFANVPGLNPNTHIDRNEALPPVEQIVHRQSVNRAWRGFKLYIFLPAPWAELA